MAANFKWWPSFQNSGYCFYQSLKTSDFPATIDCSGGIGLSFCII